MRLSPIVIGGGVRRFELESRFASPLADLAAVVACIADNNLQWSVIRYDGQFLPPAGLEAQQFEQSMTGAATGYLLTFQQLVLFAAEVQLTGDCLVVAASSIRVLTTARLNRDYAGCAVVVQRTAPAPWQVWIDDDARWRAPRPEVREILRVEEVRSPQYYADPANAVVLPERRGARRDAAGLAHSHAERDE